MYEQLIDRFIHKTFMYSKEDQAKILAAARLANEKHENQKRKSGEPYIIHPLAVGETLIKLKMDADTICAGLLHDTIEDTDTTYEGIEKQFGKPVAEMVEGVTKVNALKAMNKSAAEAETIRKMFFAMSKDVRVIIIKLADKLHNMRTLQHLKPERAKEFAQECLDIYAPLADRLGISWLKDELEDLSMKTLKPDMFDYINQYLVGKKSEQTAFLAKVEKQIYRACSDAQISDIIVTSRVKHAYSIYLKMTKRNKSLQEIYDLLGVRILCNTVPECYTILGVVHSIWSPVEGRFKDYIAMPKANNYQSLHTTVMSVDGKLLEIQIRTKEMNYVAEYGVAAHWAYKADSGSGTGSDRHMDDQQFQRVLNKLNTWSKEIEHSESFMDDIKDEILKDTIYVFTPQGHIVELASGATALDFAYQIHTEVGNHTVGAKANGAIIPLDQPLENTQVIEILTNPSAHPHVQWLRLVKTTSARRKIRAWLNKYDENVLIDKNIIAKRKAEEEQTAQQTPVHQLSNVPDADGIVRHVNPAGGSHPLRVGAEKNMMIHIAQCCNPVPGDDIVGYISRGRGIIVHKRNCPNLKHMTEIEDRRIDVEWELGNPRLRRTFNVVSKRTEDLFGEIESAVRKFKGHLTSGNLHDDEQGRLIGTFTVEVTSEDDMSKIVKSIKTIPSINSISTNTSLK